MYLLMQGNTVTAQQEVGVYEVENKLNSQSDSKCLQAEALPPEGFHLKPLIPEQTG